METIDLAASSDLRSFEWLVVGSTESTLLRQVDPRLPLSIPA